MDIARLLLHAALRENGAVEVAFRKYLFENQIVLRAAANDNTIPDTTDWGYYANWILIKMKNELQVSYKNGLWDINFGVRLTETEEIRELIAAIR
ncbi:MAG: hypothetical protein LH618_10040, partial [Saprospiraceae bacterium]|nr:hypothetical protein [Saprospiraceae bacterium]